MPFIPQGIDLTSQYKSYPRQETTFRPVASTTYTPGAVVQQVAQDLQTYRDQKSVGLPAATAGLRRLMGFVSETWPGFNGSIGSPNYTSPSNVVPGGLERGTTGVEVVNIGYHPAVLLDQTGAAAVTVTNGIPLISSANGGGYVQGVAAATAEDVSALIAIAALPASGIGSSLTAAALAQASQFSTVASPAAGDTLNLTIQSGYVGGAPGVAQTTTWSLLLNSTTAASATTAGAAMVAFLNAQPSYSLYFIATNVAGAVTTTVNTAAASFNVNFVSGGVETNNFTISISGMVANSLTYASTVTGAGGTTFTANSTTLASGTGYKGTIPAQVV